MHDQGRYSLRHCVFGAYGEVLDQTAAAGIELKTGILEGQAHIVLIITHGTINWFFAIGRFECRQAVVQQRRYDGR